MALDSESEPIMKTDHKRAPKLVRWAVMLGIIVVLNIFIFVVRSVVLQMPNEEAYCPAQAIVSTSTPETPGECDAAGGIWNPETGTPVPSEIEEGSTGSPAIVIANQGYCDLTIKCMNAFNTADTHYELDSFVLEIGLGLLAIVIGVLPIGSSIVSAGLAYGGVLTFVIASAQYWSDAGSFLRLGLSVVALAILIYIGIKRFHD